MFSSELQFISTTAKLFHLERFAIYSMYSIHKMSLCYNYIVHATSGVDTLLWHVSWIIQIQLTKHNIILTTVDDESDDELSTGVAVAISIVVTFIITLVVTALISIIITSLYYKHHYIKKSLIRQGDSHALTEDIKSNDPAYATTRANITMDTNPAYGTATTIKMDTNPAYATTTTTHTH